LTFWGWELLLSYITGLWTVPSGFGVCEVTFCWCVWAVKKDHFFPFLLVEEDEEDEEDEEVAKRTCLAE